MKTAIIIYNPKAGISKDDELAQVLNYFKEEKIAYHLFLTEIDLGPKDILSKITMEYDYIVVGGGDGTVSQVIHAMHDLKIDVPLQVIPLGTSNEIASNLNISSDLSESLPLAKKENLKNLDYGLFNEDKVFTYALSFGNFTEVTYKTPQKLKNYLGFSAYVLFGFLSFRKIKSYDLEVISDDKKLNGEYIFGSFTNTKSVGTIIQFSDDLVNLNDGLFEVLLIKKPKNVKEFRMIINGLIKQNYDDSAFVIFQSKSLKVSCNKDIAWNIDGEFAGNNKEAIVNLKSKSLQVFTNIK